MNLSHERGLAFHRSWRICSEALQFSHKSTSYTPGWLIFGFYCLYYAFFAPVTYTLENILKDHREWFYNRPKDDQSGTLKDPFTIIFCLRRMHISVWLVSTIFCGCIRCCVVGVGAWKECVTAAAPCAAGLLNGAALYLNSSNPNAHTCLCVLSLHLCAQCGVCVFVCVWCR